MTGNRVVKPVNGIAMLVLTIAFFALAIWRLIAGARIHDMASVWLSVVLITLASFACVGFFIVNPNHAAVLVLFGRYRGTVTHNGFHWTNPFTQRTGISMRIRNQETSKLKVNDRSGNPIEIAAVVVWRVVDPYRAEFEVDEYRQYVSVQSESALRHLASQYAYDGSDDELTLRGSTDDVSEKLGEELQERLSRAGVRVMEARLSHLAYAPEIASDMLRRQQATAVVAARAKIVEGAVGMVEHALEQLSSRRLVVLDEERKATMVSNLLVVLCSESSATPVVNTGTLYQ